MAAPLGEPSTRANPCCIIPYLQEPIMTQSPGAQFERLLEIVRRLREPGGCPWDREQTRTSLKPFLIEETYEVLEAIESGDTAALQDELGDLLFQVVFHAQIAVERGDITDPEVDAPVNPANTALPMTTGRAAERRLANE